MYYVYRFLNNDGMVIYVGKTTALKTRIYKHLTDGHLPSECYEELDRIEYTTYGAKNKMAIMELYYINTWFPKYNVASKEESEMLNMPFMPDDEWILYKTKEQIRVDFLERDLKHTKSRLKVVSDELEDARKEVSSLRSETAELRGVISKFAEVLGSLGVQSGINGFVELAAQLENEVDVDDDIYLLDSGYDVAEYAELDEVCEVELDEDVLDLDSKGLMEAETEFDKWFDAFQTSAENSQIAESFMCYPALYTTVRGEYVEDYCWNVLGNDASYLENVENYNRKMSEKVKSRYFMQ